LSWAALRVPQLENSLPGKVNFDSSSGRLHTRIPKKGNFLPTMSKGRGNQTVKRGGKGWGTNGKSVEKVGVWFIGVRGVWGREKTFGILN